MYCYFCGAEQPQSARSKCAFCGRVLQLPPSLVTLGRAYLLNRLTDLGEAGAIDTVTADRIRAMVGAELSGGAAPAHLQMPSVVSATVAHAAERCS